ncbi:MAG TPA: hypothetical protein V6D22_11600 [Candidatus Obscuribacterales bacterium]
MSKLRSVFVVSLALFLLINAALSFTSPFKFDPYKFSYRGWSWWAMDALRHEEQPCNVAMLGSSLVVSAVAGCDANYLNQALDLTKHHHVAYLDNRFTEQFGGTFHCFDLAAPGQMPSDAYLSLKAMVATANRPDVVIYGVGPRDFIDSTLCGPNDTEPFQYLKRIVNIDEVGNAAFRSFWSRLDWYMQKALFMYDYSLDCRLALARETERFINKRIPCPYSDHPFTWWDRTRVMPQYLPAEVHPQAIISGPLKRNEITFKDNTIEYKQRYKKPDRETFRTQMYFMRKLSEYCHRERIELVVVNMPITKQNVDILPPGVYKNYLAALTEFAWNHNIVFYDLCNFDKYTKEDFHDTVHLNAFGARKFFDSLLAVVDADPRVQSALAMSGTQLAERNRLDAKYAHDRDVNHTQIAPLKTAPAL